MFNKKIVTLIFALIFLMSAAQAKSYSGYGGWKNSGGLGGEYEFTTEVEEGAFTSTYSDAFGDHIRKIETSGSQENFEITVDGEFKGLGFCYGSFCNFHWKENNDSLEESWFFNDERLVRMGRRQYQGESYVLWQDQTE